LQNADVHCLAILFVCLRQFLQIKPCAATSTHHWIGHRNPHESVDLDDDVTAGWGKSAKILDFLQWRRAVKRGNKKRRCPGWLRVYEMVYVKRGSKLRSAMYIGYADHLALSILDMQRTIAEPCITAFRPRGSGVTIIYRRQTETLLSLHGLDF